MSDTNIQTVDPNALVDLFPDLAPASGAGTPQGGQVKFSMQETNVDLFTKPSSSTTDNTTLPAASSSVTDTTTLAPIVDGNVDILGDGKLASTSLGTPISDLSGYYQDRINSGKFVKINEEDDKGNKRPFIPKTAEEYDEVLEIQINHRLTEARKDLEKRWYESKSPAWKAISQYAEIVDDPTELIPFLSGVRTLQSVANLDETQIDGAEQIVRTRLEQNGDPEEVITQQISALKTSDQLLSTAKIYKPIILNHEKAILSAHVQKEAAEKQKWEQMIGDIRTKALTEIEKPLFGKTKLKQEEKSAIYEMIGEPTEETQGYAIYSVIDNLFDKRDFETLKLVSLLLTSKDAFLAYLGSNIANQTAASLQKKLTLAGESHSASGHDFDEENRVAVNRNQFKTKLSFGRDRG